MFCIAFILGSSLPVPILHCNKFIHCMIIDECLMFSFQLVGSPRGRKAATAGHDIASPREDGHDSGVASSYEDHHHIGGKASLPATPAGKARKGEGKKGKNKQQAKGRSELIFHLDE